MALQFDFRYPISSILGMTRLAQFILGIIVLICIGVVDVPSKGSGFIYFVAVSSLITSLIFLILFVIHLNDSGPFARIPWDIAEFGILALWTILYLICGIMTAVFSYGWRNYYGNSHSAYGAASFFCFLAALVYGVCAGVYFRRWRFGVVTTGAGGVTVSEHRTTTTTTTARY